MTLEPFTHALEPGVHPRAFLIDLDGTLADSEPLKGLALAEACVFYGGIASADFYMDVMGEDWPTVTAHFFKRSGIAPSHDEFNARFRTHYLALLEERVTLTPGAATFIAAAKAEGIKLALVSSAAPWMVDKVLDKLQLTHVFDLVITQADVSRHKPDPEAYLLALARLGVPANSVVVFEDSAAGLQAAHDAGCKSIAISHRFNARHDMSLAQRVVDNFAAISLQPLKQEGMQE
jgi:HAD superfamily hydrolase (TIGR01509 family)